MTPKAHDLTKWYFCQLDGWMGLLLLCICVCEREEFDAMRITKEKALTQCVLGLKKMNYNMSTI